MMRKLTLIAAAVLVSQLAFAKEDPAAVALKATLPGVTVDKVADGPIRGWKEVTYNTSEIAYVVDGGKHVVFGNLVRVEDRFSHTLERRSESRRALLASLPTDSSIVYEAENEVARIIVFTDVSCSFCVSFHKSTVKELNAAGVTVVYYPWPRGGRASLAYVAMRDIWCATDQKAALSAYMENPANHAPPAGPNCKTGFDASIQAGNALGVRGTPGVFDVNGVDFGGALPTPMILERLGLPTTK